MKKSDAHLLPLTHNSQNHCFGCGPANPGGLRLNFFLDEDGSVVAMPTISAAFEGVVGCVHGGVIATMLDEAMSKAVRARGFTSMTRHMTVDYQRPVPSGAPLRIEGRVTHSEGRKHWSEAHILDVSGTVLAQGKGLFIEIPAGHEVLKSAARPH